MWPSRGAVLISFEYVISKVSGALLAAVTDVANAKTKTSAVSARDMFSPERILLPSHSCAQEDLRAYINLSLWVQPNPLRSVLHLRAPRREERGRLGGGCT